MKGLHIYIFALCLKTHYAPKIHHFNIYIINKIMGEDPICSPYFHRNYHKFSGEDSIIFAIFYVQNAPEPTIEHL